MAMNGSNKQQGSKMNNISMPLSVTITKKPTAHPDTSKRAERERGENERRPLDLWMDDKRYKQLTNLLTQLLTQLLLKLT